MSDPTPAPVFGRARPRGPLPVPPRRHIPVGEPLAEANPDPLDVELKAWKETRSRAPFPWRQVSLIGGLCFGAGSLILPDTVNDIARYALYGVAAIGFFGGLGRFRKKSP